jgi:hypothetical protein
VPPSVAAAPASGIVKPGPSVKRALTAGEAPFVKAAAWSVAPGVHTGLAFVSPSAGTIGWLPPSSTRSAVTRGGAAGAADLHAWSWRPERSRGTARRATELSAPVVLLHSDPVAATVAASASASSAGSPDT